MMMMLNPYANISSCPIFVSLLLIMLGPSPLSYSSSQLIAHFSTHSFTFSFIQSVSHPFDYSFVPPVNQSVNQSVHQLESFIFFYYALRKQRSRKWQDLETNRFDVIHTNFKYEVLQNGFSLMPSLYFPPQDKTQL